VQLGAPWQMILTGNIPNVMYIYIHNTYIFEYIYSLIFLSTTYFIRMWVYPWFFSYRKDSKHPPIRIHPYPSACPRRCQQRSLQTNHRWFASWSRRLWFPPVSCEFPTCSSCNMSIFKETKHVAQRQRSILTMRVRNHLGSSKGCPTFGLLRWWFKLCGKKPWMTRSVYLWYLGFHLVGTKQCKIGLRFVVPRSICQYVISYMMLYVKCMLCVCFWEVRSVKRFAKQIQVCLTSSDLEAFVRTNIPVLLALIPRPWIMMMMMMMMMMMISHQEAQLNLKSNSGN